jgi:DNA gyrase subunit A
LNDVPPPPTERDIAPISIEEEMRRSYLDYAMSVIVARALPDVRDGLKPVHRRILFAMNESGYGPDKPFRKSARIVGDVMGKYHPHGDQAIYDAMVRMAQDFSMRLPLIDGQGNYGSMDGDPPAAMRYTEARLARAAMTLIDDIDKETVDFQPNYDDSSEEPIVLPARFPNLLVNGAGGIAVGMATNIPPHNLGEIIDACLALAANPALTIDDLIKIVPGPDFPTGGLILGTAGAHAAYHTGRGSVIMRAKAHIEELKKDREAIVITEMPYQVNKASMIEKIGEMVRNKRMEGIAELRDESDRQGVRVVIEIKRDASADVVLNQLYRYSQLQTSFGVNALALHGGRPEQLDLKRMLTAFLDFREEVIARRTRFELRKARERAHILVGLAIAVANIDEIVAIIRKAKDPNEARDGLIGRQWPAKDVEAMIRLIDDPLHRIAPDGTYRLSDAQARAILDLRLQRLTGLERDKIGDELAELGKSILEYLEILRSRVKLLAVLTKELEDIKAAFATPRRTEIVEAAGDVDDESLIEKEDMVVLVSHQGTIKRVPLSAYRAQRRGGKGRTGMATREEDFVVRLFVANTHQPILFFTTAGRVFKMKVHRLPLATPQARGKSMVNLFPVEPGETVSAVLPLPEDEAAWSDLAVMFATGQGNVRRNDLSDFVNVRPSGIIAIRLDEGDRLVDVQLCSERDDVLLAARGGKCIRFPVDDVRVFKSRTSDGVRGMRLAEGDEVISMTILRHVDAAVEERYAYLKWSAAQRRGENGDGEPEAPRDEGESDVKAVTLSAERIAELQKAEQFILSATENGFGVRTSAYDYRVTGRGGSGISNIAITKKNGKVVAAFPVEAGQQVMLVTNGGQVLRTSVADVRIARRGTQGVILFKTAEGERVVSVASLGEGQDES